MKRAYSSACSATETQRIACYILLALVSTLFQIFCSLYRVSLCMCVCSANVIECCFCWFESVDEYRRKHTEKKKVFERRTTIFSTLFFFRLLYSVNNFTNHTSPCIIHTKYHTSNKFNRPE